MPWGHNLLVPWEPRPVSALEFMCKMHCENGRKEDDDGCQMCKCLTERIVPTSRRSVIFLQYSSSCKVDNRGWDGVSNTAV